MGQAHHVFPMLGLDGFSDHDARKQVFRFHSWDLTLQLLGLVHSHHISNYMRKRML